MTENKNIIEDYSTICVDDKKIIFESKFKKELSIDECKKNMAFLNNNIKTTKNEIDSIQIEKHLKGIENALYSKKLEYEEAIKNFDKYLSEIIIEMKRNKTRRKLETVNFIKHYEQIKSLELTKNRRMMENRLATLKMQLSNDTENLKAYDNVKHLVSKKNE